MSGVLASNTNEDWEIYNLITPDFMEHSTSLNISYFSLKSKHSSMAQWVRAVGLRASGP